MSLTILSVAYPLAPVGPDAVGGAEQVLSLVEAGLVARGHRSIVIACEGSSAAGELVPTPRFEHGLDDRARRLAWARHRRAIERVLRRGGIDLVHMHGLDFHEYLPPPPAPVLATLHLPPSFYPARVFALARPRTSLVCVSRTQLRACPPASLAVALAENGVPVARFPTGRRRRGFVLALGRICPEKGFHLALDAARRARVDCRLAGRLFPYEAHLRYYREAILPRLDHRRRFLGPVGFEAKRRLLASARCLLAPSLVDETSSLVAMEALACGTPVVAFRRGALAEIVEHGRTGFLVSNVEEMAAAIEAVREIDAAACRRTALERFSAEAMVDRYLALYQELLAAGTARSHDRVPRRDEGAVVADRS